VGFALELVQADAFARYRRLVGSTVRLQTGADENALKNVLTAREQRVATLDLVNENTARFFDLCTALDISHDRFVRTSGGLHRRGVEKVWSRLREDDLYTKEYSGLYCVGCEDFLRERDLVDGKCIDHDAPPSEVRERNWFFRLSRYEDEIVNLIRSGSLKIVPENRRREVLSFVEQGLHDISVSRCAAKYGGWGIPVPGDGTQVIYVWIDALINYLSGLGFGSDGDWDATWNASTEKVHVIGKNVWKFHAIYWPALLLSAGLPVPDEIVVHGFLTENGRKISKSHGFTIDPFDSVNDFGVDAVRYYLLRAISSFEDGDFSIDRLKALYNADLANGLGNLASRVTRLCEKAAYGRYAHQGVPPAPEGYHEAFEGYRFDHALAALGNVVTQINRDIEIAKPWECLNDDIQKLIPKLTEWLDALHGIAHWIQPVLPGTAKRILEGLNADRISAFQPLFPRLR
jgi:methionyl-tRNA synthetase